MFIICVYKDHSSLESPFSSDVILMMCCVPWFNDSIDEARDARPKLKHPREKDLFTLNVSGLRSEQTKQREQARRTEGELGEKRSRDRQRERERECAFN